MLRNKLYLKIVSVFLTVTFLFDVFFAPVALALTSGPTAPEYTSFEPVDVTDMVNLATGDFSYSIPILEVPGPEGSYPLALSYHAGIKPDQEASWVGLGWTLNAGAINRMVNVYADDINAGRQVANDFWAGGRTVAYSVGIGFGPVMYGMTFAHDTYKGFGVGTSIGVGIPIVSGSSGTMSAKVGLSSGPYGGASATVGLIAGTPGAGVLGAMSVGIAYNFDNQKVSPYFGVGVSYATNKDEVSLLGASIASSDMKMSSSLAGISINAINDNKNDISYSSASFGIPIPILPTGIVLYVGYSSTRYFLDRSDVTFTYGSLYPDHTPNLTGSLNKTGFDCYPLIDPDAAAGIEADPNSTMGGSLPAYDNYMVMAQGLGGSITPYINDFGGLYRRNTKDASNNDVLVFDEITSFYNYSHSTEFRFVNDFSNAFRRTTDFSSYSNAPPLATYLNQNSNTSVGEFGEALNGNQANIAPYYKTSTGKLAGSKNIEWFTNQQINNLNATQGFINHTFGRDLTINVDGVPQDVSKQIGGFMITNESGVTYHYALPVYNYRDYSRSDNSKTNSYRQTTNIQPYAYTWLLTAITGPDFVDRGGTNNAANRVIDDADWGYWVQFDYGKWTDKYIWRNPPIGTHKDVDSEVDFYSRGEKQLYYLDAIKTRSHTALFIKDIRKDSKGVMSFDEGGFGFLGDPTTFGISAISASSMKLSKILLFTNNELNRGINELSNNTNNTYNYNNLRSLGGALVHNVSIYTSPIHDGDNVVDNDDLAQLTGNLSDYAEREIDFVHSYALCKNTPNSIDLNYNSLPKFIPAKDGKLTLEKIIFKGKGGERILPPISFEYANNNPNYDSESHDMWGMYYKDVNSNTADLKKLPRYPTVSSSNDVDAWSLSAINNGLGSKIEIEYESDMYSTSVFTPKRNFSIKSITSLGNNQFDIEVYGTELVNNIQEFTTTNTLDFFVLLRHQSRINGVDCLFPSLQPYDWYVESNLSGNFISHNISNSTIRVQSASLHNTINTPKSVNCYCFDNTAQECVFLPFTPTVPTFVGGNVITTRIGETLGGDLRVKKVKLISDEYEYITEYSYANGITSYEPVTLNVNMPRIGNYSDLPLGVVALLESNNMTSYKNKFFPPLATISAIQSVVPGPGVVYGKVTVTEKVKDKLTNPNQINNIPGRTEYNFLTMDPNLNIRTVASNTVAGSRTAKIVTLKDYMARVGNLKSIKSYDVSNNLISEVRNTYLFEESDYQNQLTDRFKNQGRIDEMYWEARSYSGSKQLMITKVEHDPVIPVSKKVFDYRTGIITETKTFAYDFINGDPKVVYSKDGMNNEFLSVSEPAYKHYPEMASKTINIDNKNMLSQPAANYLYKVEPKNGITDPKKESDYDKTGLVFAQAQTFSNAITSYYNGTSPSNPIWRKHRSFVWSEDNSTNLLEDGTSSLTGFSVFDFANTGSNSSKWLKTMEVQAVGVYSKPLLVADVNGNKTTSLTSPDQKFVIASVSNADITEIASAGAEFMEGNADMEGNTSRGEGFPSVSFAHSGIFSLLVAPEKQGFNSTLTPDPAKKYFASVWVYMPGGAQDNDNLINIRLIAKRGTSNIASGNRKLGNSSQNWHLIELVIDPLNSPQDIQISCNNVDAERSVYFDDFRVHPMESAMTTYAYDRTTTRLTHIMNNDNLYIRFKYDLAGNIVANYGEFFSPVEKQINRQVINYGHIND